ncbi:MAG: DEAD/DEAH box helicase [Thermodesulfobacteriota bacterium]
MEGNPYQTRQPNIVENEQLRIPQREGYAALVAHAASDENEREVGIIMPVGCGKSGLITISPFAFRARQVLVVAPNVQIAQQLYRDFDQTQTGRFYIKCGILNDPEYPEPVEIRGRTTNLSDIQSSDVVITNIQQLQGEENRWLEDLPQDFFDLILFDEAHHNVAASWELLRRSFPNARILNFSATPVRADGQCMSGRVIYSYPVARAIQEGYVKSLKALVLNPRSLRFVRRADGQEIEVSLDEVRRLGEEDADFRRSIVTSTETLNTIVDASIRELERIRTGTSSSRHKIIASALNYQHCIQIVQAYRARGLKADYIHSREDSAANRRVLNRLENHELDVIVQVRKLGEGFDHPFLSVAAVFSIFSNLAPFVQFVGRIMRVIESNNPRSPMNQGTVVFHAGANIASRWEDFQDFSEADQAYFDELLPMEGLDFENANEIAVEPAIPLRRENDVLVRSQAGIVMQEIPLLAEDEEARRAFEVLRERGFTAEDYRRAVELEPVPTTRVRRRQAARSSLDDRVRNEVGLILRQRNLNPQGRDLDRRRIGQINFTVLKSAIDRNIYTLVGRQPGERPDYTQAELDRIEMNFQSMVDNAVREVFDAQT